MSSWSTAESDADPIYTPTHSTIASLDADRSMAGSPLSHDAQALSLRSISPATVCEDRGPDAVLAVFRWNFTTLPRKQVSGLFTLKNHPREWPEIVDYDQIMYKRGYAGYSRIEQQNLYNVPRDIARECFSPSLLAMSIEDNAAAKLLLVVFWSKVMHEKQKDHSLRSRFWDAIGRSATELLFDFYGAPKQYIGWVQNVKRTDKGSLEGVISTNGEKFFVVIRTEGINWLSDVEGLDRAKHVIGELPRLKLEII